MQRIRRVYMKRKVINAILAGVVAISLMTGCSKSSSEHRSTSGNGAPQIAYDNVEGVAGDAEFAAKGEWFDAGSPAENAPDVIDNNKTNPTDIDPTKGRLLIRTVSMTAETKSFTEVETDLKARVAAAGGYMEYSAVNGTGKDRSLRTGSYVIRVPAEKLDELISSVGNSCTVTSSNENTSDVTLQYVDTKARLDSLEIEYEQLTKLLEEAGDLDTIFVIQNKLTEVRYEIESTKSSLLVLENQVQYATLSLTLKEVLEEKEIVEPHVVTFGEKISMQFEKMKEDTKEFFQGLLLAIIACLPGIIFLGIVVAVVLIIVFSARKKRRKRLEAARIAKEAEEKAAKEKEAKEAEKAEEKEKKADGADKADKEK